MTPIAFAFPAGLLALAALGALVWIYLRDRRQRPLEVPSLLLWTPVRDDTQRSRFRPDPLFLLQAALLAALAFGLARPFAEVESADAGGERAVFVVDTSTSMQVNEGGRRRFDLARDKARSVLGALGANREVVVIAAGSRPRLVIGPTRDHALAAGALDTLEPNGGLTRLAFGVQLARTFRGPAGGVLELDVFTDVPRDELAVPLEAGERLRYFRFGTNDDNLALASLRVYQNPFEDAAEPRAFAMIRNFSAAVRKTELRVTLDGAGVLNQPLELAGGETRVVTIRPLRREGRLEAHLGGADALAADNRALAFVLPRRPIRVLAITASTQLALDLRALAEAVPALRLRHVSPKELRREDLAAADVAIFHDFVPELPLASNALFLYPPLQSALFEVQGDVVDARILDWNERHPLLADLRYVDALPLKTVRQVTLPEWARPIITSRAGGRELPLAFAGERDGRRVACFAFDLASHSIQENENLSVLLLLLNAIRWLLPPNPMAPIQIDVGESYREILGETRTQSIWNPDGTQDMRPASNLLEVPIDQPGEYKVSFNGTSRVLYANLFDADESAIGRAGSVEEAVREEGQAPRRVAAAKVVRDFGTEFYWAALGLLAIEWIAAARKRSEDVG